MNIHEPSQMLTKVEDGFGSMASYQAVQINEMYPRNENSMHLESG